MINISRQVLYVHQLLSIRDRNSSSYRDLMIGGMLMFIGIRFFLMLLLTYIGFKGFGVGLAWLKEFFEAIKPGSRKNDD